ncbi:MAGUK p55 subfamily member 4 [Denticeps clupeoides]|uniref:MAGUK p55 subfamily member 4 n=1 Tax=Denticeps clupeoides TaxID=299321 RepID=UPI0010A4B229|nr:MAGUK p55 subfamily member 4-like [Denticeps clupeoides]XP_028847730.1 MAGUK p55 subfamily member 4-like [Denticeps clupeoides]XP_028847731.1 MAGUK p55 subfamily member 4-like [Denticeps clupeoides]
MAALAMVQSLEASGCYENGLTQILADVAKDMRSSVSRDISGAELLHGLLSAPWLQSLLKVYESLTSHRTRGPVPYLLYSSGLSQEIMANLREVLIPTHEVRELYCLLRRPHVQALLLAHDTVARKDYDPVLPLVPEGVPGDEEAMRIICLVKNNQPLGATIKKDEMTGDIQVARVIHGGLADRSGLLHPGDKLVEVNGSSVEGLEPEQVIQILFKSQGTIVFKLIPNSPQPENSQATVFLRAMADYCPLRDPTIPCPAAGMAYSKGDLLEIVDQTDACWWQARKLPSAGPCAGLVPSNSWLKRKQREMWWSQPSQVHTCIRPLTPVDEDDLEFIDARCSDTDDDTVESEDLLQGDAELDGAEDDLYLAGFRRSLRLFRRRTQNKRRLSCHSCCPSKALSSPYEEVVRYQRNPEDPPRLIVLLGPSGVGVNELRKRLMKTNPSTFQGAIPHTSRPKKSSEESGKEYHFISKELFEYMVCNHRFLEYGEFKGHLYGTSVDAIKEVLDGGKICLIDIEPHSIQSVRTKTLKPYFVFVASPSLERLRLTRRSARVVASSHLTRHFTDEDFQEMQECGRSMEARYRQYFDSVLVNDVLQDACLQLYSIIRRAQDEPQWVPVSWLKPVQPGRRDVETTNSPKV